MNKSFFTSALRSDSLERKRFPENVFSGGFFEFYFFNSDLLFSGKFISIIKAILDCNVNEEACIFNLCNKSECDYYCFSANTDSSDYMKFLQGANQSGWLYGAGYFICTPSSGAWAIYCEKDNEIAVIAISSPSVSTSEVVSLLGGMEVNKALSLPINYAYSASALPPRWIDELKKSYAFIRSGNNPR